MTNFDVGVVLPKMCAVGKDLGGGGGADNALKACRRLRNVFTKPFIVLTSA